VLWFIVKRLVWAICLAFVISFFTFLIFFVVPSDTRANRQGGVTISLLQQYRLEHDSVFNAYGQFVWRFVRHGDLGRSFLNNQPVNEKVAAALPVTLSLVVGGAFFWLLMAFPIAILSALRPRSLLDRAGMIFVLIGVSAHPVWIGLVFSYFLGYKLHLMPISGYCDFLHPTGRVCGGTLDWFHHMLLPWLTFAFLFTALYTRMIRAMVLEQLQEDYVRTARAKGAGEIRVLRTHVLRNSLLPVVTMLGMDVGLAFGGVLFVESVYDLPGVGGMLYDALTRGLDLPVMMGAFLIVCLAVVLANLIADVACYALDPRMHVVRVSSYARDARQTPRLRRLLPKARLSETAT